LGHFLDPVVNAAAATPVHEASSATELVLMVISLIAVAAGWFAAYVMYVRKPELPGKLAQQFSAVYTLVLNKYWIDELYNAVVVRPLNVFARIGLWWTVDRGLVDGSAYAAAGGAMGLAAIVRRLQSGNIRSYAGWLAGGAAAVILLMYFGFGTQWMAH
jgi:NADH-quinone oxidoreductase subunit L